MSFHTRVSTLQNWQHSNVSRTNAPQPDPTHCLLTISGIKPSSPFGCAMRRRIVVSKVGTFIDGAQEPCANRSRQGIEKTADGGHIKTLFGRAVPYEIHLGEGGVVHCAAGAKVCWRTFRWSNNSTRVPITKKPELGEFHCCRRNDRLENAQRPHKSPQAYRKS